MDIESTMYRRALSKLWNEAPLRLMTMASSNLEGVGVKDMAICTEVGLGSAVDYARTE
jgi:hypothetical protein